MGAIFHLIKTGSGEAYELGKAACRAPAATVSFFSSLLSTNENYDMLYPSQRAMWRICTDSRNCEPSILSERWLNKHAEFIELINIAMFNEDNEYAIKIANDILEWAGDDEVILIPDNLDYSEIAKRNGAKIHKLRVVRSVYAIPQEGFGS